MHDEQAALASWYRFPDAPWVRGVMVHSADGAASAAGRSGGLSGPSDQRYFETLRQLADVLLVGAGSARVEGYGRVRRTSDAALREHRAAAGLSPVPVLAVVSASLAIDPASPLLRPGAGGPDDPRVLVLTSGRAPEERRHALETSGAADVLVVDSPDGAGGAGVDIGAALDLLAARGLLRVSCEGGPGLLAQVVRARRLDELCLTTSPRLVGGSAGRVVAPGDAVHQDLDLVHLHEADGFLFARYTREA